jgi:hypothetical protein
MPKRLGVLPSRSGQLNPSDAAAVSAVFLADIHEVSGVGRRAASV